MELNTKQHGIINYKTEDIIEFNKGLPGFEELKKFILFPVEANDVFSVLHSLEDLNIGFIVIPPFNFIKDYEFNIEDERLREINITSPEDILILNPITLNSKIENITVNLRAPIIINTKNKQAEQVILDNDKYLIKYPLFKEGI